MINVFVMQCHSQGDGGESSDLKFKDDGTTLEELVVSSFLPKSGVWTREMIAPF